MNGCVFKGSNIVIFIIVYIIIFRLHKVNPNPKDSRFVQSKFLLNVFLDRILVLGYYANSADPVRTPQNAASDQGHHYLLAGISMEK